jgi:hypothetical protein
LSGLALPRANRDSGVARRLRPSLLTGLLRRDDGVKARDGDALALRDGTQCSRCEPVKAKAQQPLQHVVVLPMSGASVKITRRNGYRLRIQPPRAGRISASLLDVLAWSNRSTRRHTTWFPIPLGIGRRPRLAPLRMRCAPCRVGCCGRGWIVDGSDAERRNPHDAAPCRGDRLGAGGSPGWASRSAERQGEPRRGPARREDAFSVTLRVVSPVEGHGCSRWNS